MEYKMETNLNNLVSDVFGLHFRFQNVVYQLLTKIKKINTLCVEDQILANSFGKLVLDRVTPMPILFRVCEGKLKQSTSALFGLVSE